MKLTVDLFKVLFFVALAFFVLLLTSFAGTVQDQAVSRSVGNFFIDNWALCLFTVSEVFAFLPGRASSVTQALFNGLKFLTKKKRNSQLLLT
jgi:hypothetical protein